VDSFVDTGATDYRKVGVRPAYSPRGGYNWKAERGPGWRPVKNNLQNKVALLGSPLFNNDTVITLERN